jgi:hypothetical protein
MATPQTTAASTISAVSVVASENLTVTPMATQTLTGTGRARPASIFFKNPEVSIAQVTVTPADTKTPEPTAEETKLQDEINSRYAAHISNEFRQLEPAPPSYIPKEYEDTIDLNHPVAKQACTKYLEAVREYQAAIGSHAQELSAYYKGDHLWKRNSGAAGTPTDL